MFAFWLGRENKLSLAELWAVFPKANFEYMGKEVAILSKLTKQEILKKSGHLGGTIKIIELSENYRGKPELLILDAAKSQEGKFAYGLSSLWEKKDLKKVLMLSKNTLKKEWLSARFVNKDFKSLTSAQILWEKLVEKESDFTIIDRGDFEYFGKTIWVQDIENYGKRDYGKTRDMQVGMLPPKLAQMMVNISGGKNVYDPFVWLGTILIESLMMGNMQVFGSDISLENIEKTKKNLHFTKENFPIILKKSELLELDARGISSSPLLKFSDSIVTEWYLWEIFQKYSVTEKKIEEEKERLLKIYTDFFYGLKKVSYKWTIVISFPFWEVRGKYYYFSEIYTLIEKYCKKEHLLPFHSEIKHTRSGSLLYKRPDQIVGREIFKLIMK